MLIQPIPNRFSALGIAAHFLARRAPFDAMRADQLIRTLDAQAQRGHLLFALDGTRIVGCIGWAQYDLAVAEHFARTGNPPPDELAMGHGVIWIFGTAADHPAALRALTNGLRRRYPGWRSMGTRLRPDGTRIVFDQPIRPRRDEREAGPAPPASG